MPGCQANDSGSNPVNLIETYSEKPLSFPTPLSHIKREKLGIMSNERPPLEEMTLRQLRRVASEYGVSRYSRMRKDQLLESIQVIERSRGVMSSVRELEAQEIVEAAKFDVGQDEQSVSLASVDEGLPDLPDGYGESRIVLMPRDPQWAYAYWDVPQEARNDMRRQGGQQLALRLYDVTDIDIASQAPHSLLEYPCDELAREWYLPVPVSDRDYVIDIGYRAFDGRWLVLARSASVRIPPVYPSDWIEDHFITVTWEESLPGVTFAELVPPSRKWAPAAAAIYDQMYNLAESAESMRVAGSIFGSMQHVAGSIPPGSAQMVGAESISSYIFPSGVGMWAVPTTSGLTASGMGMGLTASGMGMGFTASGMGMGFTASGMGMGFTASGMGLTASGMGMIGSSASAPPIRPRKFWLVADAELIVYGATEPDATVTIGGQPIKLNSDGTFRFQMHFPDGNIDFPILAVAADGEQNRAVHMTFDRQTLERNTNTKAEAVEEWLSS
jgi:uncharacterized protein